MPVRRSSFRPALLALGLALLAGCQFVPVKREPPPLPFTGTKWMLVTERKIPGEAPYLEFGDGAVTGSSGCNRIMGRYLQDTVGAGAIVFSSIATSSTTKHGEGTRRGSRRRKRSVRGITPSARRA